MKTSLPWVKLGLVLGAVLTATAAFAGGDLDPLAQVQIYERAIHIMAMLLLGFGFLMVFVRGYGLSALTATYLMVAAAVPGYFLLKATGGFGAQVVGIENLVLAEFAAASLLICAGAVLGRLKIWQYLILAGFFLPAYMLNEWILQGGGGGFIAPGAFVDTGGSIVIHAFGALFGLGAAVSMTTLKARDIRIASDSVSDRFSLLGSMVLWVFWPSFCSALVAPAQVPATAMNVVVALCGSTLLTYFATVTLRRGICAADIANATLAGGVAIGSTCASVSLPAAFAIGAVAGLVSTFGFAVIQGPLQKHLRLVDTCGVSNLHGIPGLLGGLAALVFVAGIDRGAQLAGIGITIVVGTVAGLLSGRIMAGTGHRDQPYEDAKEFLGEVVAVGKIPFAKDQDTARLDDCG
jgi:ammonium transporter Rh